jgi:hypothetical protein
MIMMPLALICFCPLSLRGRAREGEFTWNLLLAVNIFELPGVARRLVTFFCFAKKKVTKEKATPIHHLCEVPCVARLVRRLRNSHYVLRQSSPTSPDQSPLLGGRTGEGEAKRVLWNFSNYLNSVYMYEGMK